MVAAFAVTHSGGSPPAIDRQAEIVYKLSEVGALVQLREDADNAEVKLNKRSRERMNPVAGFKFGPTEISADTLLDGRMRPGRDRPIHQFEQQDKSVRHHDPDATFEANILIGDPAEYMIRCEEVSFMFLLERTG
jgi:hypothetical protein